MLNRATSFRRRGSSLVEILVVIVVFLVGILAIVQIFPRGLGIVKESRNTTVANQLGRAELERLKGLGEQLPEAILAVNDNLPNADQSFDVDRGALPNDFVPTNTTQLLPNGNLISNFSNGDWKYYSGFNRFRGIVGEGRVIPAPRFISRGGGNSVYGGLMTLSFGPPKIRDTANPGTSFLVYGNDLQKRGTDGPPGFGGNDFTVFVDSDDAIIYVPLGGVERVYRLSFVYFFTVNNVRQSRSAIGRVTVPAGSGRIRRAAIQLADYFSGDPVDAIDYDSLRVQRVFVDRTTAGFRTFANTPGITVADMAYEYALLDPQMGSLLFNPEGFGYKERRTRGSVPLVARVDYVNQDWRIIRDDFRVSGEAPFQTKLILGGLKAKGATDVDNRTYTGLPIQVRGTAGLETRDFILVDTETGGIYSPDSYAVNFSDGVIRFIDVEAGGTLTSRIYWPGATTPELLQNVSGRAVRALYMARNEWAVQPVKAASVYNITFNPGNLAYDQCFPGLSDGVSGRNDTVYFPLADIGKKVMIGEIWYTDLSGQVKVLEDQEFTIQAPAQGELRLGAVRITERVAGARLDYSNGYAVRRVRGAWLSVRVSYNNTSMPIGPDSAANLTELNRWIGSLKRVETETFLMKGDQDQ
jgi:type II secretory pathway pseudopilin PulG